MKVPALLGLLLLLPVGLGCGPGKGKVSGRVLLGGTPVPGGWVTFRPADPKLNSVTARLDEGGSYSAVLPVGEVRVSVANRELQPRTPQGGELPAGLSPEVRSKLGGGGPPGASRQPGPAAPEQPPGRYVPIPSKYHAVETSGLRLVVQGGEQKHDIELR
jgi:hypothetical protein